MALDFSEASDPSQGGLMAATNELQVNGKKLRASADPPRSLLSVLRDDFDLTGTKYGCGEGQCGACRFLIDAFPHGSCQTRAGDVVASRSRPSKASNETTN